MAKAFVIHPEGEMSEKVKIVITDVADAREFSHKWDQLEHRLQAEFGWDTPLWCMAGGRSPRKKIEMTFDEYVNFVREYCKKVDANN